MSNFQLQDITLFNDFLVRKHIYCKMCVRLGKRNKLTTNPATLPFWVLVGSGMDAKEEWVRLEVGK